MLITTSLLILSGRFETADEPISYTLQRQDEATINDYNLIAIPSYQRRPQVGVLALIAK